MTEQERTQVGARDRAYIADRFAIEVIAKRYSALWSGQEPL